MKTKKIFAFVVILLLALPIVAGADITTATIGFSPGQLEITDPPTGESGMNFDFGTKTLPTVAVTYPSTNGPHLLIVDDARTTPTGWDMKVSMTAFEDSGLSSTFDGVITLNSPSNATVTGITKEDPVTITSGSGDELVMTATAAAGRGHFETEWLGANAELSISATEVLSLMPYTYEATLTWTLTAGP